MILNGGPHQREVVVWYHQAVFRYFHSVLHDRIKASLIDAPLKLRKSYLLPKIPNDRYMAGEDVWAIYYSYLGTIENQMKGILSRHSVAYWLHLYRRIGLSLSDMHDDKTDSMTLGNVRQIAELAITKYGNLEITTDTAIANKIYPNEILGGHFVRIIKKQLKKSPELVQDTIKSVSTRPEWVLRQFSASDLIDMYKIEGLSYEYWRATACMRSIGKGAKVKAEIDGWDYERNVELQSLIISYDKRIEGPAFSASAFGAWFNDTDPTTEDMAKAFVITLHNLRGEHVSDMMKGYGIDLQNKDFTTNFLVTTINISAYRRAHLSLSAAFKAKTGVPLDGYLRAMWGVASLAAVTSSFAKFLGEREESLDKKKVLGFHLLNLMQRGYSVFAGSRSVLLSEIVERASLVREEMPDTTDEDVLAAAESLFLPGDREAQIGLWSKGKRFPIVRIDDDCWVLDSANLIYILETMFFRISDAEAADRRGREFEAAFLDALRLEGFNATGSTIIEADDGAKREIDAVVKVGSHLVLFECRTSERPLDFEIGRPRTLAKRQEYFEIKVEQATTLREFILARPSGRNYDFRWAETVSVFVVSPFVEWIWSRERKYWHDRETPIILQVDEAIRWLRKLEA